MTIEDPIEATPSSWSDVTRVWELDIEKIRELHAREGHSQPGAVMVAAWLIEAPWAHPFWHSYRLSLCHLRPVAGTPEPTIHLADATHEIVLIALNPAHPRQLLLDRGVGYALTPVNFAAQMICANDAEAMAKVERAVNMIVAGKLSPDTDFTCQWVALFGNNMMLKAQAAETPGGMLQ